MMVRPNKGNGGSPPFRVQFPGWGMLVILITKGKFDMLQTQTIERASQDRPQPTTNFWLRAYLCEGYAFKQAVREIAWGVDNLDSRWNLRGICFDNHGTGVNLVTTNGHHLSVVTFPFQAKQERNKAKVVLSVEELKAVAKQIKKGDSVWFQAIEMPSGMMGVHFSWSGNDVGATLEHQQGSFPDWEKSVEMQSYGLEKYVVDRNELMDLCKQAVAWFDKPKDVRGVKFEVTSAGLRISTKFQHEDKGHPYNMYQPKYYYEEFQTRHIVTNGSIKSLDISFNPAYVLKYLQNMKSADGTFVTIWVPSNHKYPAMLKAWGSDTKWYLMSCRK